MNQVILIGRLTSDPKINETITCATFRLAVDRRWKREGEPDADFLNCKMLGEKKAAFANRWLRKGAKVAVTGEIQTGSYTNREGRTVYTTDIIVDNAEFVESKKAAAENGAQADPAQADTPAAEKSAEQSGGGWNYAVSDDELPWT